MTMISIPPIDGVHRSTFSARSALKLAWLFWVAMLVAPYVFLRLVTWYVDSTHPLWFHDYTAKWSIAAIVYLILFVAGSYFWHGHF
jgi:hypothetical protein